MRLWATVLCFLAFGVGAAWAQTTMVHPSGAPLMMTGVVCPPSAGVLPPLCPAVVSRNVTGEPVLLVLGREEQFALSNAPVGNVNWSNVPSAYASVFEQGNPLTYMRVNGAITRHGNPYYPYYVLGTSATIAGLEELFVAGQTPTDAEILQMVTTRYQNLTIDQARVLGYQPAGAFMPGVGQVYINQALVDNRFNALMPEAFVFDQQGRLLGVQYYVMSTQQVTLFGQRAMSSTMLPGAQQVTVWLYTDNPSGRFAATNPRIM